jgi:predicted RNA-binding protein with PIN domain
VNGAAAHEDPRGRLPDGSSADVPDTADVPGTADGPGTTDGQPPDGQAPESQSADLGSPRDKGDEPDEPKPDEPKPERADEGAEDETARHEERPEPTLPEGVRQRVIGIAADALGAMPHDQLPATLRPFARFAPARRAKLAATPIAAALERDGVFRSRVAERLSDALPELAEALNAGEPPAMADPRDVAAAAYLLRPEGWTGLVDAAIEAVREATAGAETNQEVARLRRELSEARTRARHDVERAEAEAAAARREADGMRRKVRAAEAATKRAEAAHRHAVADLDTAVSEAAAAAAAADAETRRLRARLAETERALAAARSAAREERGITDMRLRLLLDTLAEATAGLRRELAVPPTDRRPADTVAAVVPAEGTSEVPARALAGDDPGVLDEYLALPQVHLVVDGYNVTKSGYPSLPLREQRSRLLRGLGWLAAQTRAEVTCVFDGAELDGPVPVVAPRGVRVLFSPPGQIADELIRRLVAAEPTGRAIVVVSSDREVADGVRRSGARPVPSSMLLRWLSRT